MSYDIIYDKRFIRTTRGVIPMVLIGSSNCYETKVDGRGRSIEVRERYWSVINDIMLESAAGQEDWLKKLSEHTDAELFKEKGNWITGQNIRKWFNNCVKAASSLEDYLKWNPTQSFVCQVIWYENRKAYASTSEFMRYCHNTQELEEWIDQAKQLREAMLKDMPAADVYLKIGFDNNEPLCRVPLTGGPVIAKHGKNAYVSAYETKKSRTYTDDPSKAHVFKDINEAVCELGITPNAGGEWNRMTFVSAKTVQKGRPWIIKVGEHSSHAGQYIRKVTASHLYFTGIVDYAHGYGSKLIAQQAADRIIRKFRIGTTEFIICNKTDGTEILYNADPEKKEK